MMKKKERTINKDVSRLIKKFLDYHKVNLQHSHSTINAYKFDLYLIFEILETEIIITEDINDYSLDDLTTNDLEDFVQYIFLERNNSARTLHRKMSSLRSFFKYLKKRGYIKTNIAKKIELPKVPQKVLLRPTQKQIIHLFDYLNGKIEGKDGSFKTFRNEFEEKTIKLYFYVKFGTMARRVEMYRIKVKDIFPDIKRIRLKGKGNKERFVVVDDNTLRLIEEYIGLADLSEEDYLIRNYRNERISKRALNKRVTTLVEDAGLPDWITTHKLRKASASIGWELGIPLEVLQDNLGHKDPETTRLYVIPLEKTIEKELREKHPTSILTNYDEIDDDG